MRVNGPSLASARLTTSSALSSSPGAMPSWTRRRRCHLSITGSNSGSIHHASSLGIMWTVIRIIQVRISERSSVRAASTSAAVKVRLRDRKLSRAA